MELRGRICTTSRDTTCEGPARAGGRSTDRWMPVTQPGDEQNKPNGRESKPGG